MTSKFLLFFGRLNLSFLSKEREKKVREKSGLEVTKAVKIFEYRKSNDRYWDKSKLHHQVIPKALLIMETLYPRYSLSFLFGNVTSHSMYSQNVLYITNMNKGMGEKQPILRDG